MSDSLTFTFPAAVPGPDSVSVVRQKGVEYIGRRDTDGPAVWEAICSFFGVDSLAPNTGTLLGLYTRWLTQLPNTDPLVYGAWWNNSGIATMSSGLNSEQGL